MLKWALSEDTTLSVESLSGKEEPCLAARQEGGRAEDGDFVAAVMAAKLEIINALVFVLGIPRSLCDEEGREEKILHRGTQMSRQVVSSTARDCGNKSDSPLGLRMTRALLKQSSNVLETAACGRGDTVNESSYKPKNNSRQRVLFFVRLRDSLVPHCRIEHPAEAERKSSSIEGAMSTLNVVVPLSLIEPLAAARLSEGGKVYAESSAAPSAGLDAASGAKGEQEIRDRLTRYGKLRALLVGDIVGTCCSALAEGLDRNDTRIDNHKLKNDGGGKERLKSESDDCDVHVFASSVEPKKASEDKPQTPGSMLLMRNAFVGLCQALFVFVTTANLARVVGSDAEAHHRQQQRSTLFDFPFLHDVLIARLAAEVSTRTFLYPNEGLAKLLLIEDNHNYSISPAACDTNQYTSGVTACDDNDVGDTALLRSLSDFSIPSASAIAHRFARPWLWCPVAVAVDTNGKGGDGNSANRKLTANTNDSTRLGDAKSAHMQAPNEAHQCKEDALLLLLESAPQTTRLREDKTSYANKDSNASTAENQLMSADAGGQVMPQQQKTRKLLSLKSMINTAGMNSSEANETNEGDEINSTHMPIPTKSLTYPEGASNEVWSSNIVPKLTSQAVTTNTGNTLYHYVSADIFRHYTSMLIVTAFDKGLRSYAASTRQESLMGGTVDSSLFACVEDLVDAVVCKVQGARRDLHLELLSSSRTKTGPKIDYCWGRAILTFIMKRYAQRVLFDPAPATPPTDAAVVKELVAACGIDANYKRGAMKGKVDAVKSVPNVAVLCHSVDWKAPASMVRGEGARNVASVPLAVVSTEVCLKTKVHANEAEQRAYAVHMNSLQKEATRDVIKAGMKGRAAKWAKSGRRQPRKKKQVQTNVGKSAGRKRSRADDSIVKGEDNGWDNLGEMSSELSSSSSSSASSSDSEDYDSEEEAFIAKNTSKIEARVKTLIGSRERRLIDVQVVFMGPRVDTNAMKKERRRSQWLEQDDNDESLPSKGSTHSSDKDRAVSNSFPHLVDGASTGPFDCLTNEELYRDGVGTQYKCFVFRHITYRCAARQPQREGGGAPRPPSSHGQQQPPPIPITYTSADACYVVGCYDINPRHLQPLQRWHTVRGGGGGGGGPAPALGGSANPTPHAYDYQELRPVSASAWLAEGGCVPPQVAKRILDVAGRSNQNNDRNSSAVLDEGCCMYEYRTALSVDPLLVVPNSPSSPLNVTSRVGEHGRTEAGGLFLTLSAVGETVTTEVFYALVLPVGADIVVENMIAKVGERSDLAVRPSVGGAECEKFRSLKTILFDPSVVAERLPQPVPLPAAAKPPRWPVPNSAFSSQYDHTLPYSVLFCAEGRKGASSTTVIRHVVRVFEVDKDLAYGPKRRGQGSDEDKESGADGEVSGSGDEDNAEESDYTNSYGAAALREGQRIRRPSRAPSTASSFSSQAITDYMYVKPQPPFMGSLVPVATLSRMCAALRRTLAKSACYWAPVGQTASRFAYSHNPQSAPFRQTQLADKSNEDYSSRLLHALAPTMQRVSNAVTRAADLQGAAAGSARPIPALPPPISARMKSLEARGTSADWEKSGDDDKGHRVVDFVFDYLFGPPLFSPSDSSSSHSSHHHSTVSAASVPPEAFFRFAAKAFADTLCYCTVCAELPPALADRLPVKREEDDQLPKDKSDSLSSPGTKRSVLKLGSRFVNLKEATENTASARAKRRARSVNKVDPTTLCCLLDGALRKLTKGFERRCQEGEDRGERDVGAADDPKRTLVLSFYQLRDIGAQLELAGSTSVLPSGQATGAHHSRTASLPIREVVVQWIHSVLLSSGSLTD